MEKGFFARTKIFQAVILKQMNFLPAPVKPFSGPPKEKFCKNFVFFSFYHLKQKSFEVIF
jgi:hypothetical protein